MSMQMNILLAMVKQPNPPEQNVFGLEAINDQLGGHCSVLDANACVHAASQPASQETCHVLSTCHIARFIMEMTIQRPDQAAT